MSQKQDRINDVLAERITQLEKELRAAVASQERAEKETRLVKTDAYEVIEQWSSENAELRQKLSAANEEAGAALASVKNRDETIACLKEELEVAQQLASQYSESIKELQVKNTELEKKLAEMAQSLSAAQAAEAASAQQVGDYERLVTKFQAELKEMMACRKDDAEALDELRISLNAVTNENRVLRKAGEDVSFSTGKLLERVSWLKEENEAVRRRADQLSSDNKSFKQQNECLEQRCTEQRAQITQLTEKLATANAEVTSLHNEKAQVEKQFAESASTLKNSQAAAEQQLELIQNLERDVQELKDNDITTGKAMEDLEAELLYIKRQLEDVSREKEDLETEFATMKECYSTLAIEFDDYKRQCTENMDKLNEDYSLLKKDAADRLSLTEQNYNAAWSSVQDLTTVLHTQHESEFAKYEQIARYAISLDQQVAWSTVLDLRLRDTARSLRESTTVAQNLKTQLRQTEQKRTDTMEQLEVVTSKYRTCEHTLLEQRKAFSALESQFSQSAARLKESATEREKLVSDNEWLKQQMDSMRQELGELDEILNSNLNEMREENERLQLDNETLRQQSRGAHEKEAQAALRIDKLEADAAAITSEVQAQTKTLEITEAELQATKAQAENLSTSLQFAQKRVEEVECANSELSKSNRSLATQVAELRERVGSQDAKLSLILSDKRKESEGLKVKLNSYVERCEKLEEMLFGEANAKKEAETAAGSIKEQNAKLRAALDELKSRCSSDAESLKRLLAERDDLMRDRDLIVEKYNKLHDAFRNVRKEAHGKVADELRKVMDLAVRQESELQTLRRQNTTLKKSVSMFVESAQPKAEAIFMERLNLTEGPLRHPKKRSTTNPTE